MLAGRGTLLQSIRFPLQERAAARDYRSTGSRFENRSYNCYSNPVPDVDDLSHRIDSYRLQERAATRDYCWYVTVGALPEARPATHVPD